MTIADSVTRAVSTLTAAGLAATEARQDAAVGVDPEQAQQREEETVQQSFHVLPLVPVV